MPRADHEPVTYEYASHKNITFHGKGLELGYNWGEWRQMSRAEQDDALTGALWELVDLRIEDDES